MGMKTIYLVIAFMMVARYAPSQDYQNAHNEKFISSKYNDISSICKVINNPETKFDDLVEAASAFNRTYLCIDNIVNGHDDIHLDKLRERISAMLEKGYSAHLVDMAGLVGGDESVHPLIQIFMNTDDVIIKENILSSLAGIRSNKSIEFLKDVMYGNIKNNISYVNNWADERLKSNLGDQEWVREALRIDVEDPAWQLQLEAAVSYANVSYSSDDLKCLGDLVKFMRGNENNIPKTRQIFRYLDPVARHMSCLSPALGRPLVPEWDQIYVRNKDLRVVDICRNILDNLSQGNDSGRAFHPENIIIRLSSIKNPKAIDVMSEYANRITDGEIKIHDRAGVYEYIISMHVITKHMFVSDPSNILNMNQLSNDKLTKIVKDIYKWWNINRNDVKLYNNILSRPSFPNQYKQLYNSKYMTKGNYIR